MDGKREEILYFISHFSKAVETFTGGCCYWFAYIMKGRFPEADLVYMQVPGHFVVEIGGRLYDATGDVTEKHADDFKVRWADMDKFDSNVKRSVERDVIFKRKREDDDG